MRLKIINSVVFLFLIHQAAFAQVWFPEGVYTQAAPSLIEVDNQLITVARSGIDNDFSYWQVCINDGKSWLRLPVLKLNKLAEIQDVKRYQGSIYLAGNFTYDNGNHNALIRYSNSTWQGLGLFRKQGSQLSTILSLDVHNNLLVLGGSFYTIGMDTIPYLATFNGAKYADYFEKCRSCAPDNIVTDIASNDSIVAISGYFTTIGNHKSKYLIRINKVNKADTFLNTPKIIEKIALDGTIIFGSAGLAKDKSLYRINNTFVELKSNMDSAAHISSFVVWEKKLIVCGSFFLASNTTERNILLLDGSIWKDISNNYKNATYIATGRSMLFAVGTQLQALSIWNPNRFVVRFYPNLSLVKAKVFIDSNNNCIQEKSEKPLAKQYIKLPLINRGVFTNENGYAEFMVPNAIQTTYRFVVKPFRNFVKSNCSDTSVTKTFYPGVFSDSIQFPLNRIPNINDIKVRISSPRGKQVLKDKKVLYYIHYENVGSNPISGNIRLRKNPLFTKEVTLPLYTKKLNDSILEWNYNNLQPGESKSIVYTGYPEDVQFDQIIQFDAQVSSSIASGSSPYSDDDMDSIPQETNQTVQAFRKDVYPTPDLGDSITYLHSTDRDLRFNISFNNFSTDTVFYAVVIDTLDLNLDMSFIEITGSNNFFYTEVQTDPNNQYKGILIWHFPNIRLAPNPGMNYENTESGSYIGFKVVTKPLSQGYFIRNTASVFYDNTFAGNTNSVYCALAITSINSYNYQNGVSVYPNPFNNTFDIQYAFNKGDVVQLYDATGRMVYKEVLVDSKDVFSFHNNDLPNGIYILQIQSKGKLISIKVVKS